MSSYDVIRGHVLVGHPTSDERDLHVAPFLKVQMELFHTGDALLGCLDWMPWL